MFKSMVNLLKYMIVLATTIWLWGCASTSPIRHLSSDVCLVLPESTTKTEVLAFLGEPDQKNAPDGLTETWIYYKKNENLVRKLPLVGGKFGSLNYEMVTVSFTGELVRTCIYRQLEPSEIAGSPDALQAIVPE